MPLNAPYPPLRHRGQMICEEPILHRPANVTTLPTAPRPTLLDSLYRTVVECVLPGRHLVNKLFKNIFSYLIT